MNLHIYFIVIKLILRNFCHVFVQVKFRNLHTVKFPVKFPPPKAIRQIVCSTSKHPLQCLFPSLDQLQCLFTQCSISLSFLLQCNNWFYYIHSNTIINIFYVTSVLFILVRVILDYLPHNPNIGIVPQIYTVI